MNNNQTATPVESGNFVVMDNGNRFYLHVIGLSSASRVVKTATEEPEAETIQ